MNLIKQYQNKFLLNSMLFMLFISMYLFKDYLYLIFIAIILSFSTNNIFTILNKKIKASNNKYLKKIKSNSEFYVSLLLSLSFLLIIFLPLIYILLKSYSMFHADLDKESLINYYKIAINYIQHPPYPLSIFENNIKSFVTTLNLAEQSENIKLVLKYTMSSLGKVNSVIFDIFILLFIYFLINLYSKELKNSFFRLLPIDKIHKKILIKDITSTSTVILYGTIFNMLMQGFAFYMFIMIAQLFDPSFLNIEPLYLGIVFGFFSIIPLIGSSIVFLPIAIYSIIIGKYIFAVALIIYCFVFIGIIIDNIFKAQFMHYIGKEMNVKHSINALMIIIAMITSVGVIGFWGVIIGPALISLTITLIKINYNNLKIKSDK